MITVFDSSNYAQQVFFNEAFAYLKAKGNILNNQELAAGKFLSLDGYFAHISDLVAIQPSYVLIPSDEAPFEIDANSRTIKVPANFSKCAGVVGDNMCEIITFTIDRYFDYTDLANAHICIQWQAGEEKGVSQIGLRDYTTTPGKIRFGWPLTSNLTKQAGNISFAVRFYIEKTFDIETGEEVVDAATADPEKVKTQFVYLFNTLPATIPIREGLNVIGGEGVKFEQGISNLFTQFVSNSQNPSYAIPEPVEYVDNCNLKAQEKIDLETNTVTLKAQATAKGEGWIIYEWFFKNGATLETEHTKIEERIEDGDTGCYEVNHFNYEEVGTAKDVSTLPKNKQYYYTNKDESGTSNCKPIYYEDGKFKANGEVIPEDAKIFERYTTLKIKDDLVQVDGAAEGVTEHQYPDITGLYYVKAKNVIGKDTFDIVNTDVTVKVTDEAGKESYVTGEVSYSVESSNYTPPLTSVKCLLPGPAEIKILDENNLQNTVFLNEANNKATLEVHPDKDPGNPDVFYTWYKSLKPLEKDSDGKWEYPTDDTVTDDDSGETTTIPATEIVQAEGKNKNSFEVENEDASGWYWAKIKSQLNRRAEEITTPICRVTEKTKAPIITSLSYNHSTSIVELSKMPKPVPAENDTTYEEGIYFKPSYSDDDIANQKKLLKDTAKLGNFLDLFVDIDPSFNSKLKSDSLTYEWYCTVPDETTYKIVDEITDAETQICPYEGGDDEQEHPIRFKYTYDEDGNPVKDADGNIISETVFSPKLRVCCLGGDKDNYYTYSCKITNTLNGEVAYVNMSDINDNIPTFDIY